MSNLSDIEKKINSEILNHYEKELKKLILEIVTPSIPFTEKEIK